MTTPTTIARDQTVKLMAQKTLVEPQEWAHEIIGAKEYLRHYLETSGQQIFVIGLSGGVDSAVVATLAHQAVGPKKVLMVAMPYGSSGTNRFHPSHTSSLECANKVSECLTGACLITDDITEAVDTLAAEAAAGARNAARIAGWDELQLQDANLWRVVGNIKARVRAVKLRAYANMYQGVVLGTENLTENLLGYFTIGGDEETDVEVLSPYLKTQVRALARALNVCAEVREKSPSADLWADQTDEGELGFTYDEADLVLNLAHKKDMAESEVTDAFDEIIPPETVGRIFAQMRATQFKRDGKQTFAGTMVPVRNNSPVEDL
jgi:NAD+ synthase